GKLLFLTGQWMQDPQVFAPDGASGYFPAESFTIVRHADTGTVLKLEVRGKRLNRIPEVALDETGLTIYPLESFKPSVILNGTIGPLLAQPT
ncbi:MAG: hypothetical protein NT031_18555, partial [Planctomycetota bacterium]|nr:hypothetical protein [Planctomycetota bacterium]